MFALMTTRFAVLSLLVLFVACGQAVAIECPKAEQDTYVLSSSQKRLLTKGTYIDLVNEIDEMSASLKTQKPDISYSGLVDAIVAVYCPVVADLPSLSEQEKRDDVRKFSAIVMKQLSWDVAAASISQWGLPGFSCHWRGNALVKRLRTIWPPC